MAGGFMIAALSFAFGAILFWSPAGPSSSGGTASAAAGGQAVPAGSEAESDGGGALGMASRKVSTQYDSSVYIMKNKAGDVIGDGAVDATKDAVEPGVEAASHAVASVLPSSISHYVPWLAGAALYKAEGNAKESLGNVVEDNFEAAADAVKPGGGSGDGTAASPGTAGGVATASAGIVPGGSARAAPTAAASLPATGISPTGMVTPAAWGGERWTIRLGRFATAANADTFASELSRRGVPARVTVSSDGGRYWSFVQSGSYDGRGAAEMALRDLQARGYGGSIISEGGSGF
jgi:septal ring-binding cell division protein DamX